jgi:hypothetical protein
VSLQPILKPRNAPAEGRGHGAKPPNAAGRACLLDTPRKCQRALISEDERTTYRFGSYDHFVEMAEEIRKMQDNDDAPLLPPVVPESS